MLGRPACWFAMPLSQVGAWTRESHTFASWAIAGGMGLFYLARVMGTSVAQLDATYGHLLPDSKDYLRGLLDTYDAKTTESLSKRQKEVGA